MNVSAILVDHMVHVLMPWMVTPVVVQLATVESTVKLVIDQTNLFLTLLFIYAKPKLAFMQLVDINIKLT